MQAAAALEVPAQVQTVRVTLPERLRLADAPILYHAVNTALSARPSRLELDASQLRVMTDGLRYVLLSLTDRLERHGTQLVLVGCEPFE